MQKLWAVGQTLQELGRTGPVFLLPEPFMPSPLDSQGCCLTLPLGHHGNTWPGDGSGRAIRHLLGTPATGFTSPLQDAKGEGEGMRRGKGEEEETGYRDRKRDRRA